jgi:hypothetical protein
MVCPTTLPVVSWARHHRVILGYTGNHGDLVEFLPFNVVPER